MLGRALPFWAGKREGVGEPGPCWPWGLLGPRERKGGRAGLLVLGWGKGKWAMGRSGAVLGWSRVLGPVGVSIFSSFPFPF